MESMIRKSGRISRMWLFRSSRVPMVKRKTFSGLHAQAVGAQLDLQRRFFAGVIQHLLALLRQHGRYFEQQGRLPHPGLAADQDDRVGDDAPAQDAVEFVHAGDQAPGFARVDLAEPPRLVGRLRRRRQPLRRGRQPRPWCSRPGIAGSGRSISGSGNRTRCTRRWEGSFVFLVAKADPHHELAVPRLQQVVIACLDGDVLRQREAQHGFQQRVLLAREAVGEEVQVQPVVRESPGAGRRRGRIRSDRR